MSAVLQWMLLSLSCGVFLPATAPAQAGGITVAAASDLSYAITDMVAAFERQTGHDVRLSLGSSGNFLSQIQTGAPFDVYFSADIEYPRRLEVAGLVEPGTLYRYAVGRIVLWVRNGSPIDVGRLGIKALLEPSARKIAIANPRHAPYGRAAVAAMKHFGVYEQVRGKLVLGENISQAAQFVESGNSDIGILALSLAQAPALSGKGRHWLIPETAHPVMEQAAVILRSSTKKKTAAEFMHFIRSEPGAAILRRYGFIVPGP
jgi:molybdate transport system substrate-binding protein